MAALAGGSTWKMLTHVSRAFWGPTREAGVALLDWMLTFFIIAMGFGTTMELTTGPGYASIGL